VEHVWIDVACIDQTPGSAEMATEIGRQAKIFRHAKLVFAWLTTQVFAELMEKWAQAQIKGDALLQTLHEIKRYDMPRNVGIDFEHYLLDNPWFSSLWTLQEMYPRQDALLMTREGTLSFRLEDLAIWLWASYEASRSNDLPWSSEAQRLQFQLVERSGMGSMGFRFPIILLVIAKQRRTAPENITDRVHGIMQVFDFRLGKSRPGSDPSAMLTTAWRNLKMNLEWS
jgi:hypothetical protein